MSDQSVSWAAVLAALAAQAATVTGIAEATSTELDGIGSLPSVKVQRLDGLVVDEDGRIASVVDYLTGTVSGLLVLAYPGKASVPRITGSDLVAGLFRAARQGVKLGQPNVVIDSWLQSAQWDDLMQIGDGLPGYHLTWVVQIKETFDVTVRTA